jgi:hypothetical protein
MAVATSDGSPTRAGHRRWRCVVAVPFCIAALLFLTTAPPAPLSGESTILLQPRCATSSEAFVPELPPGFCGFVAAAGFDSSSHAHLRKLRGAGDAVLISGDSMARQTLLGITMLVRRGSRMGHARPAAEHYFHCDAVYAAFHNGSDVLMVDVGGHCRQGANAAFPVHWIVDTLAMLHRQRPVVLIAFVWNQVETIGSRVPDAISALSGRGLRPSTHVVVPGYSWSPAQLGALLHVANTSMDAGWGVLFALPPPSTPFTSRKVHRGMKKRNAALVELAHSIDGVRVVDAQEQVAGRCDGVHYLCILVPHVAEGPPSGLRAPCSSCNDSAVLSWTRQVVQEL